MIALQGPDSLRAILDSVFRAPAYQWVEEPDPFALFRRQWLLFQDWWQRLAETHPNLVQLVGYGLLAILLVLVVRASWALVKRVRSDPDDRTSVPALRGTQRDQHWYRREADRLALDGRFTEAVQADFLALILALDHRQVLRFHPSKTPGEYVAESRLEPGAREDFRDLVLRLYRYAFARWPCGAAEFAEWRTRTAPDRYAPAH